MAFGGERIVEHDPAGDQRQGRGHGQEHDLQAQEAGIRVGGPGVEADQVQADIGDADGGGRADLHRAAEEGVEQAGAVGARRQPLLVAHIGHHGAQQEGAGREGQADQEHEQGGHRPVAGRDDQGAGGDDGVEDRGDGQGPMLAGAVGQPRPQRPADQAADEVDEQQAAGLGLVEGLHALEEEEEQGAGDGGARADGQVGGQQTAHAVAAEELQVLLESRTVRRRGQDRLGHLQQGQADGERQEQDDEPAHGLHADGVAGHAQQAEQRGQGQHQDHAHHVAPLPPGVDARSLVIAGGEHRAPGQVRQGGDGEAGIDDQQPEPEIADPDARLGHEQHVGGQHEDRRADREPQPEPAIARPGLVHHPADEGIEGDVEETHAHEGRADGREVQAELVGVELRQIDHERKAEAGQGQARCGERREGQARSAVSGHGHSFRKARATRPGSDRAPAGGASAHQRRA